MIYASEIFISFLFVLYIKYDHIGEYGAVIAEKPKRSDIAPILLVSGFSI